MKKESRQKETLGRILKYMKKYWLFLGLSIALAVILSLIHIQMCIRDRSYAYHIETCGEERNSYSKTDHDATFMRLKRDYMGNDQLPVSYTHLTQRD